MCVTTNILKPHFEIFTRPNTILAQNHCYKYKINATYAPLHTSQYTTSHDKTLNQKH